MMKWLGALLIIGGGGMFGFSLAAAHKREEKALLSLISALDYMQCELQYRQAPLPELCRLAGSQNKNHIGQVLLMLARELECQISPDVECCMEAALQSDFNLPSRSRIAFETLGQSLGRFDLDGQVQGLESVRAFCRAELEKLGKDRDVRLRSYQTLGLCAGAALAILMI